MSVAKAKTKPPTVERGKRRATMAFKFENLEVWKLSLEYCDEIYRIADLLPSKEEYNLKTQMRRSATSICLNIAEGSTSQSDPEFSRFLGISIRSCIEVVACLHLARRKGYIDQRVFTEAYEAGSKMFAKLQALRKSLK
jgi:four helix bundle protein